MGFLREKPRINKTLIPLKVVVFFVISGITALHVLHATKPQLLGLNFDEYRSISILAPFISILGPLIVGPLADRLAAKNSNTFGRTLRFLTAFLLIIAALIYACLFAVPDVQREAARRPSVSFGCNENGAVIFQERCGADATCHNWKGKVGSVNLTKCTYNCQDPSKYENMYTPWLESVPTPSPSTEHSSEFDYEDESTAAVTESLRTKRAAVKLLEQSAEFGGELISAEAEHSVRVARAAPNKVYVQPPHLCITEKNDNGDTLVKNCHVYTDDTPNIIVHSVLRAATNIDNENDTHSDGWCKYPLDGFQCSIPAEQAAFMIQAKEKEGIVCKPMIECQVIDPYDSKGSVLADSECMKITGDLDATLGGYTAIRFIGDIFPMAALTLLNTAIVIAVRETSEGRGEVCRQYAWGAIGYVLLFSPLDAFFFRDTAADTVALILVIVCFLLAALVLIFANGIPLSPPEWWWHTKTGVMVYPMSAIRRYSPEIFVLTLVAVLFGTFWSSIHTYLRWTFSDGYAVTYSGLLLVLALLWNVDKFIEYCGHSNIFIGGFGLFIIRFTALSGEQTQWLTVVMEILEPLYIGVIWITIILYMRHAMPRKLTATGQAICVAAFFCLGKGLGALIGLARDDKLPHFDQQAIHQWLAVAACIIALVYFVMYNLILAPRCTAKPQHNEELMSGASSQNFNGNGNGTGTGTAAGAALNGNGNSNYSPLRVYHNERGKKGQFRY